MKVDNILLDALTAQAQASPHIRMNMDLRNSAADSSQRMLNVLMTDTVIPIHRHTETSETEMVCRGKVREEFYDAEGNKTAEFVMEAGGTCLGVQVPLGQYHTLVCLEDGSVIFEAKGRPYDLVKTEDFWVVK